MKTRAELEQMLMQKFFIENGKIPVEEFIEIKNFIFDTIIPEVLNSVIPSLNQQTYNSTFKNYILPKIKELYGIDL